MSSLPVAVIGSGPIGLAAAAELVGREQEVIVFEQGDSAAAGVRSWGHVRLFSPWAEVTSPAAVALLQRGHWQSPDPQRYPTGHDWADNYLVPLVQALGDRIRVHSKVIGVARLDRDLTVESGRLDQPFVLHIERSDGAVERVTARSVIDASGTLSLPNPLGSEGYPAAGEPGHAGRIDYSMPDPSSTSPADQSVAVVGSGSSALTSLIALTEQSANTSRIVWVLRRSAVGNSYGGGDADELPARGALGTRVRQLVDEGRIEVVTGFRTVRVEDDDAGSVALVGTNGHRIGGLDRVICVTGFRPDLSFLSEVRLNLDQRLQAPVLLAPEIDPNWHSCGSVRPHGHRVLSQPEEGLYLVGMKSYGRAPSFLAMTGYEQVRSIAAALAGDRASADAVELTLPDTGLCGGAGLFDNEQGGAEQGSADQGSGGCCGAPEGPQPVAVETAGR